MGSRTAETVVIGLNWVGDNILALPTYRALQHRFRSEGGIAVAAPRNVADLLSSSGIFRKVIAWNGSTTQRILALRENRFRRAIILPNSFRSAAVTFAAGIRERWGYSTDVRQLLLTHRVRPQKTRGHQLDDYAPLLAALSAPRVVDELPTITLPTAIRETARQNLLSLGLDLDKPLFGIHAGGLFGRAKHWGDDRFRAVATKLRADGAEVVLLTSPGERLQAEAIAGGSTGIPMIGHEGDVLHLAAALSHCSVIITNDSGPLHLAAALAVPTVSIFGPTDPERTVIPGASRVVRTPITCQPCYKRECPLGHHRCMAEIGVDDVYTAAVSVLAELEPRVVEVEERRIGLS
ncbi:MAG TPA: lipopolysaccharide heptosyltransferase II [Thermoanaerobaculia bacterium]|nr:lipopolysaccharide heptosyltransferase II [Thermoanaerobaculia bacterium]